jgi:excinuclease ABC subunit C
MAQNNAENTLRERLEQATRDTAVLEGLQRRLRMDRLPERIECFDNSNLAGTNPVAAMVVFIDGRPYKAGYRRFAIRTVSAPDDYASMAEVLSRRYGKINAENPEPDLLLVDGGKGQLNIALAVLNQLGINGRFAVAGIAKKDSLRAETEDKIYLPHQANPVNMGRDGRLLLLLQQIRDEAHRFAITFQRRKRARKMIRSALDQVGGVGPKRKALLMRHFGSIKKIRAATVEELSGLPGINAALARAIKQALSQHV